MKLFSIPLKRGSLQIVFSWQIRRKFKHVRLSLCGTRRRKRFQTELTDRIRQEIYVKWRWFPFFDYLYIQDGQKHFAYYGNDPFPLKCFVEYEFWKYKNKTFDTSEFLDYMTKKFFLSRDEVIDGCNAVMLNVYDKHKGSYIEERNQRD